MLITVSLSLFVTLSCSKEHLSVPVKSNPPQPPGTSAGTIGLIEKDSSIFKELDIIVSKIGTSEKPYNLFFDTGSAGMVIDAEGLVPASLMCATGFMFSGDSTTINGITITKQTAILKFGVDNSTFDTVYGNLAYADVIVGKAGECITVKHLPFFLYYKGINGQNVKYEPHHFDVFGVSSQHGITFNNNAFITSPFSCYDPGSGLTRGFKMAALGTTNFSALGNYVPHVVTIGLSSADLSSSSGFVLHPINNDPTSGYVPTIQALISYNNKTVFSEVVFDTGTQPYNYIEDNTAPKTQTLLPANTVITVSTLPGFNYKFTTSPTDYLTYVENPSQSGLNISVVSLEFFLKNEYLLDYTNHQLGLKNN